MNLNMHEIIDNYVKDVQNIYGSHLKQIILYGSYARGDFNKDSDIDIMLLVDLSDEHVNDFSDTLSEIGFVYNINSDVWIMPVVKNIEQFNYWKNVYPFYSNISKEGVLLYAA